MMLTTIFHPAKLIIHKLASRLFLRKSFCQFPDPLVLPVCYNAPQYGNKVAIYDQTGSYSFRNLFIEAQMLSSKLSILLGGSTGERVLFLCPNDASYVITIWAIWMAGQIAVPLSPLHPEQLLEYYIKDANSRLMVSSLEFAKTLHSLSRKSGIQQHLLEEDLLLRAKTHKSVDPNPDPLSKEFYQSSDALILYTSGTTGNPKGVVLTHRNINVQLKMHIEAWKWSASDMILHTLPLHHVHGTLYALFCPLFVGASIIMLPKFNAALAWSYLLNRKQEVEGKVSVFMAVPTIFSKLIEEFDLNLSSSSELVKEFLSSHMRLMVSGSAPLPEPVFERWLAISGYKLLERYGMTEIGMALTNDYDSDREPGFVGMPLPSVSVALADPDTKEIVFKCANQSGKFLVENTAQDQDQDPTGELLVKGESVFREYFNKPQETLKEFTEQGWFITGDIAQYSIEKRNFKMLGRKSADIIKSGGYKISALQIETLLLAHPGIKECTVLGVPDQTYGERVAAVLVFNKEPPESLAALKEWCGGKMPKYWVPTVWKVVENIPKNALGKVNKRELRNQLFNKSLES
ncbi:malonate--CoA ligase ACSF3, mitochondrial-like isoform X1 [Dendroctonus ponderosae]|nr:malonate--CoA ligase ACSF3, mitochondrial isoform X1 [Dendroctonus ponderosae]XP_048520686.1 malonate--CoA ligase ACSF3, mitochondrial isoform X1 [Dendroctonus ponderosae]XP_048521298.1 malonate--CoA ligase ACSF3, mitochondrial-like isoform X1 [Dendroctonus ponderosae]KAH0999070.1 hypothetical protein HUJ05_008635 [Dendroctonus ponderosae]KAH1023705.1 hypothetical protein HUJ05_003311 [Dendroctonus ponderosae]